MPPVTRSQTKPAISAGQDVITTTTTKAAVTKAVKKAPAKKKAATKSKSTKVTPNFTESSSSKPAPKKRKANHNFTLCAEIVYWNDDTDENDYEQESFTGTKAAANHYFKEYLKELKRKDRGDFRNAQVGKLERDKKGLFKYEYDDMPEISRKKVIMTLNMFLTMDIEDTRVEDDELDTSSEFGH
ncbi:hypothetical protein BJ508DRAFT_363756 [Ascobolus immersus RN42]|uniref:Uncharacterized protein n=1 Tax=Ascobolus immersus RN42 TaxID=1160509 RepID=A0A3N4HY18_ASCIM|nr:hypothetical protein BJ508DRAFT_363756 [Ascobolus immersus RN42]